MSLTGLPFLSKPLRAHEHDGLLLSVIDDGDLDGLDGMEISICLSNWILDLMSLMEWDLIMAGISDDPVAQRLGSGICRSQPDFR